jgi:hypothetical protein
MLVSAANLNVAELQKGKITEVNTRIIIERKMRVNDSHAIRQTGCHALTKQVSAVTQTKQDSLGGRVRRGGGRVEDREGAQEGLRLWRGA